MPSSVHSNGGHDTAIIVVGPSTEGVAQAAIAAQTAGRLVVEVELLEHQENPWTSTDVVGSNTGCALWPGGRGRTVCVRSDPAGLFLVANIDIVLRSNSVSNIVIAGDAPADFIKSVTEFTRARGYGLMRANDEELAALSDNRAIERPELLSSLSDRIAPGAAALVLIDVQNDFCAPEGATGRTGQSMKMIGAAVNRTKLLLDAARKAGLFVVHVRAEYGELYRHVGSPYRFPAAGGREPAVWTASAADLSASKRFPAGDTEICAHGSWGAAFVEGIEPLPGEAVVAKHRFSAFADTGLDLLLRARGIRSLILAGVTTNCCVESTAREAVMRDFYLVVAGDCVAVKDHLRDLHDATLETLGLYFGLVRPSEDLIRIWSDSTDAARPGHATCTPTNELKSYPWT
ncbi:cysteine hydrolase family protein [Bradyrhizobium canariense]|uniref:cysteine hydrolase family protein n=1 Tax=Bradyrhizobium canariense TaxID=255045 RepID=UPI0014309866|nr:isochorismatase family cysteine hydrolase [Bradyrhizobium canariense]